MKISETVCLKLADWFRKKNLYGPFNSKEELTEDAYFDFYFNETLKSNVILRKFTSLKDKNVLDLGCGLGAKTLYFARNGTKSIVGIDIDEKSIERARIRLNSLYPDLAGKVKFEKCDEAYIPFPSNTFDAVVTMYTFEHFQFPERVLDECLRVVKENSLVFIDFQTWWGPHGAHLFHMIPIPWCHVFFSEKTLINVAASIYDSNKCQKIFWDFESNTGRRKKNVWKEMDKLQGLNKMTVRRFRNIIKKSGYPVVHFKLYDYSDAEKQWIRRIARVLKIPSSLYPLNEFMTRKVVCILAKNNGIRSCQ